MLQLPFSLTFTNLHGTAEGCPSYHSNPINSFISSSISIIFLLLSNVYASSLLYTQPVILNQIMLTKMWTCSYFSHFKCPFIHCFTPYFLFHFTDKLFETDDSIFDIHLSMNFNHIWIETALAGALWGGCNCSFYRGNTGEAEIWTHVSLILEPKILTNTIDNT